MIVHRGTDRLGCSSPRHVGRINEFGRDWRQGTKGSEEHRAEGGGSWQGRSTTPLPAHQAAPAASWPDHWPPKGRGNGHITHGEAA